MKIKHIDPPRVFQVGNFEKFDMKDCARIELTPNEQITFTTESGAEYDIARKAWGFYATPSINARLVQFGFKTVLVRNPSQRYFLMLVEKDKIAEFKKYSDSESLQIILWLDETESLQTLTQTLAGLATATDAIPPCICGSRSYEQVFNYDKPPEGEIRFEFSSGTYSRQVHQCRACGHFRSTHHMNDKGIYSGEYVSSTYGDAAGVRKTFDKINNLPPEKSDNVGRVKYVCAYMGKPGSLLDVGSGLSVFPYRMKQQGWDCTALDPDARAAEHAKTVAGVKAICGDFMTAQAPEKYDLVSFNKVLEHVADPVAMLRRTLSYLKPTGTVYIELPDGEIAWKFGKGREEFFIDHPHIFSLASMSILAGLAGFQIVSAERLQEPSTKYTLRAFLKAVTV